jgi:hypothetical protein
MPSNGRPILSGNGPAIGPGDNLCFRCRQETAMDDETLNVSIRKFLKMVGVSSQREIERAVEKAISAGAIGGSEAFPATMTLDIPGLKLNVKFDGEINLQ